MARPQPSKSLSRRFPAFSIAAAIGVAFFAIWWATSPGRSGPGTAGEPAVPEAAAPPAPAGRAPSPSEIALPRGGSLTGSTGALGEGLARLTHATLVRINRSTDQLEPWIAESWTASPDNRTYIITLRRGLLWSDGTPLTLEDVVASLASVPAFAPGAMAGKAATPGAAIKLAVRAIDEPIPPTAPMIEVTFSEPFAPGLRILDRYPILPRRKTSEGAGLGPFVGQPAAKGRQSRTLVRNPHYWRRAPDGGALPYLDEVNLVEPNLDQAKADGPGAHDFNDSAIRPDDYEALKKLEQSGKGRLFELGAGLDAHAMWFSAFAPSAVPPSREALRRTGRRDGSSTATGSLLRDTSKDDKPWLTSDTFRLAISAAVDRRQYCAQVYFGACDPIAGPVTPANAAWFNPDLPLGRGDPLLAREMLVDLGLRDRTGDGLLEDAAGRRVRFSLLIRRDLATSVRAGAFLKEALRAAGIEVEITPLDASALSARRSKGNYEAIYDLIAVRDTDPAMNLDFWMSSGAAHVWSTTRQGREADWEREIDRLMLKNAQSFDRVERLQAFAEVQRIYSRHMPALFFGAPHVRIFTSPRVLNATPSPLRPHLLWNADSLAALQ